MNATPGAGTATPGAGTATPGAEQLRLVNCKKFGSESKQLQEFNPSAKAYVPVVITFYGNIVKSYENKYYIKIKDGFVVEKIQRYEKFIKEHIQTHEYISFISQESVLRVTALKWYAKLRFELFDAAGKFLAPSTLQNLKNDVLEFTVDMSGMWFLDGRCGMLCQLVSARIIR